MNTEREDDDDGPSEEEVQEEQARRLKADERMQSFVNAGFKWRNKNELVDPNDPDVSAWRHPYTHEVLLSPKLVERLKAMMNDGV